MKLQKLAKGGARTGQWRATFGDRRGARKREHGELGEVRDSSALLCVRSWGEIRGKNQKGSRGVIGKNLFVNDQAFR